MMPNLKVLKIQLGLTLLALKKEIPSLVMFKMKISQAQECMMNKIPIIKKHLQ